MKNWLILIGGYLFWAQVVLGLFAILLIKTFDFTQCSDEVVQTFRSPQGKSEAQVMLRSCGATTDFVGTVNVKSEIDELSAENIFKFEGRPRESGLKIKWDTSNQLSIEFSSLKKVRAINPHGRKSNKLAVNYVYVGNGN